MQIDWRLKSFLFGVADKLPDGALYVAQKYVTGRARQRITRIDDAWRFHSKQLKGCSTLLEFGAGKNLAQNLYLSTSGIRQTVIDLFSQLDMDLVQAAADDLRGLGVKLSKADLVATGITYAAPVDMRNTAFPDGSFDCCVSTNTMEHIPAESLRAIFKELTRVIRPGGIVSAQIDYTDHYAHTDRNIGLANYLRFTDRQWSKHNHGNHFQNRLRHEHYRRMADEAGLECVLDEPSNPYAVWPVDARDELLTGAPTDRFGTGRFVWRVPG